MMQCCPSSLLDAASPLVEKELQEKWKGERMHSPLGAHQAKTLVTRIGSSEEARTWGSAIMGTAAVILWYSWVSKHVAESLGN